MDRPKDQKAGLTSGQKSWQTNLARHGREVFVRAGAALHATRDFPAEASRAASRKGQAVWQERYGHEERSEQARRGNMKLTPEARRARAKKASEAAHAARRAKEAAHAAEVAALKTEVARLKARLGEPR